ncbi:MAG: lysostaphin resistance A-like protein [Propionibacteriaceae bacterium]
MTNQHPDDPAGTSNADPTPNQPPYPQPPYPQPAPYGQPTPYGAPAYGPPAYGVAPRPPAPVSALPTEPAEYEHLARGPKHRWWRPLVSALLMITFTIVFEVVLMVALLVGGLVLGQDVEQVLNQLVDTENLGPLGFAFVCLTLIVLIPAAMLSVWIGHGIRPGYVSSVAGRIRWKWLLRCVLVTLPLWAAYLAFSVIVDPEAYQGERPEQWIALLVIAVVMVPFQAAGEEYAFRGWFLISLGSWFPLRVLALVLPGIPSVLLFALAHGSMDGWVLADLGFFAAAATILVWRTGGLEAGIAIHTVNNVMIFAVVITMGGFQDAFVGAETTGSWQAALTTLVVQGLAVLLILWQAKRVGLERLHRPKEVAPPPAAAPMLR